MSRSTLTHALFSLTTTLTPDPGPSPNRDPEQGGELRNKPVDLLTLTPESDLEVQCTR